MVPVEEVPLIQSRISQSDLDHCSGPHYKWLSKTPPRADGCHLPERRRLRDVVEECDRPQEGHLSKASLPREFIREDVKKTDILRSG